VFRHGGTASATEALQGSERSEFWNYRSRCITAIADMVEK
jgi:hypothetical protein